jgi:hypothetical protein
MHEMPASIWSMLLIHAHNSATHGDISKNVHLKNISAFMTYEMFVQVPALQDYLCLFWSYSSLARYVVLEFYGHC